MLGRKGSFLEDAGDAWLEVQESPQLGDEIARIMRILGELLDGSRLGPINYNFAQKISWIATRGTTRPEDMAYCLLELINISMPLSYGEGGQRAWTRLLEE